MLDIMLACAPTAGKNYTFHAQIPTTATWNDLVVAWHQQAELLGFEEHKRFPVVAA
jgi:hypothetical protein